ncbi:dihydrofolate reductase [Flavobacterium sp.]|uniref:dihydrofolate reductase n=1 Tax=Flavobacterium sp. TaxID=239 RepID=UPI003D0CD288
MRNITLIAAAGQNNELGKDNQLLWHLPDDFKHFKTLTAGHYIIMGRKTFESFPKPLPNRTHIIITRNENYNVPQGCILVNSLQNAIAICPKLEDLYVIGGGEIYHQSINLANRIELTRVHEVFEADTYFPTINKDDWTLANSINHPADEKHLYSFTFETYIRK